MRRFWIHHVLPVAICLVPVLAAALVFAAVPVATANRRFGPVSVLVNNAAIIRPAAIEDTSLDDYLSVINVNQVGCFLGMRAVVKQMQDDTKVVRFGVNDKKAFNLDTIKETLSSKYRRGLEVVEPAGSETRLADDQQVPVVAEEVGAAGDGARPSGRVGALHVDYLSGVGCIM